MNLARPRRRSGTLGDALFWGAAFGAALLVLILLGAIAMSTLIGGYPTFARFGFGFLSKLVWDPVRREFGALVPIYGTLVTALIGLLLAVPVAFGIAVFLTEVAPRRLAVPTSAAIELLAGIPSIIYGMWGLFVFAPFMANTLDPWLSNTLGVVPGLAPLFSGPPLGLGMLTAGIILSIMIVPFIAAVMRDVFRLVPPPLRESAFALGATRWEVVWHVALPYTRTAVWGAILLGLGRALGETMAVTFVLGNSHDFNISLLAPSTSIAATIANEFTEADSPDYLSALIALGFILFVITFLVLLLAKLMLLRLAKQGAR